ncbi:MAG: chemotaxis protein CheA [Planctomycetes bacterium]|nr:chemotaxis protein CheA [Planctomycetota bacterium]
MQIDLTPFRQTFLDESVEHVAAMEEGLLSLESRPDDNELLNSIFRAAHSIKGGAGSFGFEDVAHFTHSAENLLDKLRNGEIRAERALVDLLLRATDMIKLLLAAARANEGAPGEMATLLAELDQRLAHGGAALAAPLSAGPIAVAPSAVSSAAERRVTIHFTPSTELFHTGMDPLLVLRDLASLGKIVRAELDAEQIPIFEVLEPESCHLSWTLELATEANDAALRDVFLFVEDGARLELTTANAPDTLAPPAHAASVSPAQHALPAGSAGATPVPSSAPTPAAAKRPAAAAENASIRVGVEKVDQLINLIGELVISQSMVTDVVNHFTPDRLQQLRESVLAMQRNTRDLQERVMAVRMVPIGSIFSRYPRMVRDLSGTFGKSIRLELEGEETELDKGVVEKVGDPLTHLIRNSCDHGIETREKRLAAGKSEEGVIKLSAFTEGGAVYVEISDDGGGLDTERIRRKAVEKGLMRQDDTWSDEQIHQLIFQPAFSTAEKVTDVSGRGVGMDVVKKNVEALGGTVAIHSQRGLGARFRIKLPLTLAILDGLTLSVGRQMYILPLVSIVESFRPRSESLKTVLGRGELMIVRSESLPLLRLHRIFGIDDSVQDPSKALVVVVEGDGRRVALLVDELCGQQQVVIKNLDANFRRVEGVMGATIMGDGRIALILDVPGLIRLAGVANDVALAAAS